MSGALNLNAVVTSLGNVQKHCHKQANERKRGSLPACDDSRCHVSFKSNERKQIHFTSTLFRVRSPVLPPVRG